jgi:hypothetical protein
MRPDDRLDGALTAIYEGVEAELRAAGAACAACGRCCRFAEYGHELWLTNAELAYLHARHGRREAAAPGACPYLDGDRCAARAGRALACRTFHCGLPAPVVERITNAAFERLRAAAHAADVELEYVGFSGVEAGPAGDRGAGAQAGATPRTNP